MRGIVSVLALLLPVACTVSAQTSVAITNAATFSDRVGVAPGGLATLFGTLSGFAAAVASSVPWPTKMAEVQVLVNGTAAPLYYVGPSTSSSTGQINFQVPAAVSAGGGSVVVTVNGTEVARGAMSTATVSPGIFITDYTSRQGAILNQDNSVNTMSSRAHRGDVIQIFGTGQGALQTTVEDGHAARSLAHSTLTPSVYISGVETTVTFSGVNEYPGLWQINAAVPNRPFITGPVPVVLTINGVQSNQAIVWVVD